jgi:hypothetical protein
MDKYDNMMISLDQMQTAIDQMQTEQDFADAIRATLIPVCKLIDAACIKGFHPAFQLAPNDEGKEAERR